MPSGTQPRRKQMSTKKSLLIIGVLLIAAFVGLPAGYRLVTAPWSIGLRGRDTLTRAWAGPMQARLGAEYGMYLDLQYKDLGVGRRRSRRASRRNNLEGRGAVCTRTGEVYEYKLLGKADRSGKITTLWMEYGDPKLSALNMSLRGPWQAGRLTVTSNKNPFLPDGRFDPNRTLSSTDPDDSFAPVLLQHGDRAAFEATCARIRTAR